MSDKIVIDVKEMEEGFQGIVDVTELMDKISYFLKKYSDNSYMERKRTAVPGVGKQHGVPVPVLRELSQRTGAFCKEHPESAKIVLRKLWETESREERIIAAEAVAHLFGKTSDLALSIIMEFIPDLNNWEICDSLAINGMKPYTMENPDIVFRMVGNWVRSPNPWVRRFGLVSLVPLAHSKEHDNIDAFLVILKRVMKDPDEIVQKAASWILREITEKDPHRVGKFLEVFVRSPEPATQRIIKEGSKKLDSDVRDNLVGLIH